MVKSHSQGHPYINYKYLFREGPNLIVYFKPRICALAIYIQGHLCYYIIYFRRQLTILLCFWFGEDFRISANVFFPYPVHVTGPDRNVSMSGNFQDRNRRWQFVNNWFFFLAFSFEFWESIMTLLVMDAEEINHQSQITVQTVVIVLFNFLKHERVVVLEFPAFQGMFGSGFRFWF